MNPELENIILIGTNHKIAPVELREKLAFSDEDINFAFNSLLEHNVIDELFILSTCNRLEIVIITPFEKEAIKKIKKFLKKRTAYEQLFSKLYRHKKI